MKKHFDMTISNKIFLIVLCSVLMVNRLIASDHTTDSLLNTLSMRVVDTIYKSKNIPGLLEESEAMRTGMFYCWQGLVATGVLEATAPDKDVRPLFVGLQAIIEHVLANALKKEIRALQGVIHAPMPATPFCTEGAISAELVHPSILGDSQSLFTVKARTTILRDYLYLGGNLYIVYPQKGFNQRTELQQQVYRKELTRHTAHLFDRPLNCESIDRDLIGAFYLFQDQNGKEYVFAIKMTQANSPQEKGNFALWFGPLESEPIKARISTVMEFIHTHSSQPIPIARGLHKECVQEIR